MTAVVEPSTPVPLRRVHPPDAPFPGELVTGVAGQGYRVAAEDVPSLVWSTPSGGHLLAAVDVDVLEGTTMLLLPRLVGRLSAHGLPSLSAGQVVTLAVSVLRGAAAAASAAWRSGEWWLTEDGRPVLVPAGETSWAQSSAELIASIPATAIDADMRRRLIDAVSDVDTLPRAAAALEDALFAGAEPEPIDELAGTRPDPRAAGRDEWSDDAHGAPGRSAPAVAALLDAGVLARVAAAYDEVRAALSRRRGLLSARSSVRNTEGPGDTHEAAARRASPRRLVIVAASVMAVLLTGALMWPSDQSDGVDRNPQAAEPVTPPSTPDSGSDAAERAAEPGAEAYPESASTDPVPATPPGEEAHPAAASIERLATCWRSNDLACRAGVLERADATVPDGVATADVTRSVVLLDDLGGVEVVRVEDAAGELPPQIAVIVLHNDERLVRDVYDVADQP
ncbi:hypothetical protein [Microbacterium oleivorans]|uniref:Uncharacterized protein n=1 Tax=Microbacterium oleivorans TaxID=273677 RepID=A0A7D5IRP2_9MICO|nr:hypothetical protein [Microbacterium oleivorans]QLD12979.1 hypothetical protein HW566_15045 [Microbacterium oleivorans]